MKFNQLITLLLLTSFSWSANASIDNSRNIKEAYKAILSLHFEKADVYLDEEKKQNPKNVLVDCIRTYKYFMKYSLSSEPDVLKSFENYYDKSLSALDDEDESDPYRLYYMADLYIQSAFVNAMASNFITAGFNYRKAYNTTYKNYELFPDFILNNKSLGVMNIGVGSVPKSYSWILDLLNLTGDINTGYKQFETMLNLSMNNKEYDYLFIETLMMYSFTQSSYNNGDETSALLDSIYASPQINEKYKNNQLYIFSKSSYHFHRKENDKAIICFKAIQNEYNTNPNKLYYLDYMYGNGLLYKLDINSLKYYKRYIYNYPGTNYVKACYHKSAWINLILKGENYYLPYMQKIIDNGSNLVDADKLALKEAESEEIPNPYLLKARMLFDGGYYNKADSVLFAAYKNDKITSERDKLEYIYRLGRINDERGNFILAEKYYKETIKKGRNYEYFYAAKSALQLGYKYESMGNYLQARKMYELIFDLDFNEYENSITQKAKSGLSRIEGK